MKREKIKPLTAREKRIAFSATQFAISLPSQGFWFVNPKALSILYEHCAEAASKRKKP